MPLIESSLPLLPFPPVDESSSRPQSSQSSRSDIGHSPSLWVCHLETTGLGGLQICGRPLLMNAEAQNEIEGPVPSVHEAGNAVRNRAGLPDIATDLPKEQMWDKISHERRVELAFEGLRYTLI